MKRENVHSRFVSSLLTSLPFFTVVISLLIFSSQAQASGKIVIRQFTNQDPNLQIPDLPGFDSQWPFADEQKKLPKQMKFFKPDYSQHKNGAVPENPVEVSTDTKKTPHYKGSVTLKDGGVLINVKTLADKKNQVMLPQPADYYSNFYPVEIFFNGEARRIVVWNGKEDETGEQLLICTDDFRSATGQSEAVLSVIPLPGKPLQIFRAPDCFECLQNAILCKNNVNPDDLQKFPTWNGRIAPYSVQAFEINNLCDFLKKSDLMAYSAYGSSVRLQIRPKQLAAVQRLLDEKKYTFFAFDISWLRDRGTITEPVAYITQSSSVRIPLLENAIGGANEHTTTNAIIITPAQVTPKDGLNKDDMTIIGKTVVFTVEELENISPEIAAFCKKHNMENVLVRQLVADGKLTEYPNDINLINVPEPKTPTVPPADATKPEDQKDQEKTVPQDVNQVEQKDAPNTDTPVEPAKEGEAKPTETPQENNPASGIDKTKQPDKANTPGKAAPAKSNGKSNQGKAPA